MDSQTVKQTMHNLSLYVCNQKINCVKRQKLLLYTVDNFVCMNYALQLTNQKSVLPTAGTYH